MTLASVHLPLESETNIGTDSIHSVVNTVHEGQVGDENQREIAQESLEVEEVTGRFHSLECPL